MGILHMHTLKHDSVHVAHVEFSGEKNQENMFNTLKHYNFKGYRFVSVHHRVLYIQDKEVYFNLEKL